MKALDKVKTAAAWMTDRLASVDERMPGVAQLTLTLPGVQVTVTPKPPDPPKVCATCRKPHG